MFPLQNDTVAVKQSELRQQKALTAEEDRRRMNLLNGLSRGHTTTSDDSESFCEYNNFLLKELLPEPAIMRFAQNRLGNQVNEFRLPRFHVLADWNSMPVAGCTVLSLVRFL